MQWDFDTVTYNLHPALNTDNTSALQNAINTAASKGHGLYITGAYGISATGLTIPSNANIKFIGGGMLKLLPYSTDSYDMLKFNGCQNVVVENPVLDGSKELNGITTGEWGMGLGFYGSTKNVTVIDPVIRNTWGDGIYVSDQTSNVTIFKPYIAGVRRNGISIISANGLTIYQPVMEAVNGTDPKAGIDIEPNSNNDVLKGIVIVSPRTIRCNLGLSFYFANVPGTKAQAVDIQISDFQDRGCLDTALTWAALNKGTHQVSGHINITSPQFIHSAQTQSHSNWDNSITFNVTNPVTIA